MSVCPEDLNEKACGVEVNFQRIPTHRGLRGGILEKFTSTPSAFSFKSNEAADEFNKIFHGDITYLLR